MWDYYVTNTREDMQNPYVCGDEMVIRMAEITIDDPDEYRSKVPVDDRGRVVVGKAYSGENVNVAIEIVDDDG